MPTNQTFAARMLIEKARKEQPQQKSKAFQQLKPKQITEDMDPKVIQRKIRELEKKKQMKQILIEKGLRIPDQIDSSNFDASKFATSLLQRETNAYLIPYLKEPKPNYNDPKAAVWTQYLEAYSERLRDFQAFFTRKMNFAQQTADQYRKRQLHLERQLLDTKKKLKLEVGDDEKFDNTQDTRRFEIKKQIRPQLIFVTQNAYRVTDVERVLRNCAQAYSFFTRHYPIQAVCEMINDGHYQNCRFMITTTSRLLKLMQLGFIDISTLKHVVIDCSYRDDKDQTPFEYDMSRADLRAIVALLYEGVKYWIL